MPTYPVLLGIRRYRRLWN